MNEEKMEWPWIEEKIVMHENPETGEMEEWIEGTATSNFIAKYTITAEAQKAGVTETMRKMSHRKCKEAMVKGMLKTILPELQTGQFLPDGTHVYVLKEAKGRTLIVSPEEFTKMIKEVEMIK